MAGRDDSGSNPGDCSGAGECMEGERGGRLFWLVALGGNGWLGRPRRDHAGSGARRGASFPSRWAGDGYTGEESERSFWGSWLWKQSLSADERDLCFAIAHMWPDGDPEAAGTARGTEPAAEKRQARMGASGERKGGTTGGVCTG